MEEKYLTEQSFTYIVQVNGKVRASFDLPSGYLENDLLELAKLEPKVAKYLIGDIVKVIFVPDKLLNIVVRG